MRHHEIDANNRPNISGIYCITNTVNGKQYVGLSKTIFLRWKSHCKAEGSCPALHNAIRKHGVGAFEFEILEGCDDHSLLFEKEVGWISKLNTTSPSGYNLTYGGEGIVATDEIKEKYRKRLIAMWEEDYEGLFERLHSDEVRDRRTETLSVVRYTDEYREAFLAAINTDEYKQRASTQGIERWADPEYKAKMHAIQVEVQNRPHMLEAGRERMLAMWEDEGYRQRMIEQLYQNWENDPERAERQSSRMLELWSDVGYKRKVSDSIKKALNTPEMHALRSSQTTALWQNESHRQLIKEKQAASWKTPERKIKHCFPWPRDGSIPPFSKGWALVQSKGYGDEWYDFALSHYTQKFSPVKEHSLVC